VVRVRARAALAPKANEAHHKGDLQVKVVNSAKEVIKAGKVANSVKEVVNSAKKVVNSVKEVANSVKEAVNSAREAAVVVRVRGPVVMIDSMTVMYPSTKRKLILCQRTRQPQRALVKKRILMFHHPKLVAKLVVSSIANLALADPPTSLRREALVKATGASQERTSSRLKLTYKLSLLLEPRELPLPLELRELPRKRIRRRRRRELKKRNRKKKRTRFPTSNSCCLMITKSNRRKRTRLR